LSDAITQNSKVCWELRRPNGDPEYGPDADDRPHYRDHAQAIESYESANRWLTQGERGPVMTPYSMENPCWMLMLLCGYVYDEDGDGVMHAEDKRDLIKAAKLAGFRTLSGGAMLHPAKDCEECDALFAGGPPPPAVISAPVAIGAAAGE
jgi:hypothetical protein